MGKHELKGGNALTVAVFGSCVTRDNFNRTFNPNYKDLFECVALADHVSLVSLMAPPVSVDLDKLDGLEPRIHENLKREFSRSFLDELTQARPDYLVMDFWPDLIFGFADLDGGDVITHNGWSTVNTAFFKERTSHTFRPDRTYDTFFARWKAAADAFFQFASTAIPDTRIVVHSARNVRHWVDKAGALQDFGPWPVSMNKHWAQMDAYILDRHTPLVVDVMTDELKSFEAHPWGKFPVHYTFDYHAAFLSRLTQIAIHDLQAKTKVLDRAS